jgi:hypothetical protein
VDEKKFLWIFCTNTDTQKGEIFYSSLYDARNRALKEQKLPPATFFFVLPGKREKKKKT